MALVGRKIATPAKVFSNDVIFYEKRGCQKKGNLFFLAAKVYRIASLKHPMYHDFHKRRFTDIPFLPLPTLLKRLQYRKRLITVSYHELHAVSFTYLT
jgi:hypothetical protein